MTENLPTYHRFTNDRLAAMGKVYYSGKANAFQKGRYEQIRDALFAELKSIFPDVPAHQAECTACYFHAAIDAVLYNKRQEEKHMQDRLRANAHTAHEQLKNWK